MPAASAGEPLMGASTTILPEDGSLAIIMPTPLTLPSLPMRKSWYCLREGGKQWVEEQTVEPAKSW